jgi:glycosyltransferase involved in cell wall biosynthesis
LTVAENLGERRKGGGILQDFLESWDGVPIRILFLGNTAPLISNKLIDAISLGFINDDILKRIVYSAADVMLHPARVDNLPNVVIESMACGTPVLGFSIGGMPDMVTSETGWLTSQVDHHGLIDLLEHVTQNVAEMKQKAKSAREYTEKNYSLPIQAKAYLELISTQK